MNFEHEHKETYDKTFYTLYNSFWHKSDIDKYAVLSV
jgi:hypothetical protein